MLNKIRELEAQARQLDPGREEREAMLERTGEFANGFLDGIPESSAFVHDEGSEAFSGAHFPEEPSSIGDLVDFFQREVTRTGANPPSDGYLAYVPGGGVYPSALGDFLADVTNRYAGVAFAGPGATRMEQALIRWMCELVGYPESASGDLTSGGSVATLSALIAARDAHGIEPSNLAQQCIYMTSQAHHCIRKALHVAGLSHVRRRTVPMDDRFRMDAQALQGMIEADRRDGYRPWLVVASAGTTDTGAVDPVPELADIAQQAGAWFHVDAAYGGFFLLCSEGQTILRGIDRADSVVLDPHKGLSLPFGSGAVLVKDGSRLAQSFSYFADYLQDAKPEVVHPDSEFSPADYSIELTRPFRGPRMWFPLKLFGLGAYRASLEEKIWLARYFHREIARIPGFEAGPEPDLSIVTYRYLPRNGDADDFNRRLVEAVLRDGRVFISSTRIDGRFILRLAVLHFRTHLETIDYLLEFLQTKTEELERLAAAGPEPE